METESVTTSIMNHNSRNLQRLVSSFVPVLLIAISYVDPGKWIASVEGGSRYGSELVFLVILFNCIAVLCQCLSTRVAVVTGKDLAQICNEEYDKPICVFLGVQAELSMIILDLTMVIGTAHGLSDVFEIDFSTCVFLTIISAFLFPLLTNLENGKAKLLCIFISSTIMFLYFFGVLMSRSEASYSNNNGVLPTISGESVLVLMGLLGSSIMPHNFYLHSSIVQQDQTLVNPNRSKEDTCQDHLTAIICIFSGISVVNYILMNLSNTMFNTPDSYPMTFQDALSLLDQVFSSSLIPFALLMIILLLSNQIMVLTWNFTRRNLIHGNKIRNWVHYITIRSIAIIPVFYCVYNGGAEGVYQLLIYSQVMVALTLPSSIIPLFRVVSSFSIMGGHKVSKGVEFIALTSFICVFGLKCLFIIEMIFGKSDWSINLNSIPFLYIILFIIATVSFIGMLWLTVTPLKSASFETHTWVPQNQVTPSFLDSYRDNVNESSSPRVEMEMEKEKEKENVWAAQITSAPENKTVETDTTHVWTLQTNPSPGPHNQITGSFMDRFNHNDGIESKDEQKAIEKEDKEIENFDLNLPETLLDSSDIYGLATVEEDKSEVTYSKHQEIMTVDEKIDYSEPSDVESSTDTNYRKPEQIEIIEKSQNNESEAHSWEPKSMSENKSEGPGSFRSVKGDDLGSGTGSLSRLAGLGRAARRQLTTILDEFWGQVFDFHGLPTQEAKNKRLNILLGVDKKSSPVSNTQDLPGYGRNTGLLMQANLYGPGPVQPVQPVQQPVQLGSPQIWSNQIRLLDPYMRNSFDANERRYSSVHIPSTNDGYNIQPATIHGYELANYLSQIAKEKGLNNNINGPKSVSSSSNESFSRPIVQKTQSAFRPPGFHNVPVPRNSLVQTANYDVSSPKSTSGNVNVKKYYSLPDIHRDSQNPNTRSTRSTRPTQEQNFSSNVSRPGPVGFNELSPSKVCRDAFSLQISSGMGSGLGTGSGFGSGLGSGSSFGSGSLWSKQPFEQFGPSANREQSWAKPNNEEIDIEGKLIQSFRYCILKLLKLEGSDWLFRQNDGVDEDLIDRVAARESFHIEFETKQMINRTVNIENKGNSQLLSDESDYTKSSLSFNPYCGEGCIYKADLIISFGVWCIHRILELSLMESRPELWGKYTYVLNRLQGIIDLAFAKTRPPTIPCFCLDLPPGWQQKSSPNGALPSPPKLGGGKFTTASSLLDMVKDVELAISCRKGRSGTAAGDVAFPKGKENLASVLKRYKRRLTNKPVQESGTGQGQRKVPVMNNNLYGL